METAIEFMIRASVYLAILGTGYYLLLAKSGATAFNRFYILATFILTLGLASIDRIVVNFSSLSASEDYMVFLPEIIIGAQSEIGNVTSNGKHFLFSSGIIHYIVYCMLMVAGIYLSGIIYNLAKITGYIRTNPREKYNGMELVLLPVHPNHSPFSFFRWIFIPQNLKNSEHFDKVITHEKAHYLMGHTWDLIFMELMRLVFWFHPLFHVLKKEIQTLHEYDADNYALKKYSRPEYQRALLDFAMGAPFSPVTNPFNVSTTKKRFIMINEKLIPGKKLQIWKLFAILTFVAAAFLIQACDFNGIYETKDVDEVELKTEAPEDDEPVFTVVETMPEYPGGDLARMQFLQSNLQYPEQAREQGLQGTVFVTFIIEADGSITNTEILRGVGGGLDEEAMRVINLMPNWTPGSQRGVAVRVQYNFPIRFVLD